MHGRAITKTVTARPGLSHADAGLINIANDAWVEGRDEEQVAILRELFGCTCTGPVRACGCAAATVRS
jgi:hypothetical protein